MEKLEQSACLFVHVKFHNSHLDLKQRRFSSESHGWMGEILLVPFLSISRRPRSFSSTFVCVRSVFQIATSNGWCLSLKARSVEGPLLTADEWCVGFSSRWLSFSRWISLLERDDRCSIWVLENNESRIFLSTSDEHRWSYLVLVLGEENKISRKLFDFF